MFIYLTNTSLSCALSMGPVSPWIQLMLLATVAAKRRTVLTLQLAFTRAFTTAIRRFVLAPELDALADKTECWRRSSCAWFKIGVVVVVRLLSVVTTLAVFAGAGAAIRHY